MRTALTILLLSCAACFGQTTWGNATLGNYSSSTNGTEEIPPPVIPTCTSNYVYGSYVSAVSFATTSGNTYITTSNQVATATFSLCAVAFDMYKVGGDPTATMVCEVRDVTGGLPGAVIATSSSVTAASVTTNIGNAFVSFAFPSAPTLVNGQSYCFGLKASGYSGTKYYRIITGNLGYVTWASGDGSTWSVATNRRLRLSTSAAE